MRFRAKCLPRVAAALLTVMLPAALASCGSADPSLLQEDVKAYIWRFQEVPLSGDEEDGMGSYVSALFFSGGRICTIVNRYGAMGGGKWLVSCDADGEDVVSVPLEDPDAPMPENGSVNLESICGGDGVLYGLEAVRTFRDDTGEEESRYALLEFTTEGEVSARYDLPDAAPQPADDYYYIEGMDYIGDGRLLFHDSRGLFAYDTGNGKRWQVYEAAEDYFDAEIVVLRDGTVLAGSYGESGYSLRELDVGTGALSEEMETPPDVYGYNLYAGDSHDCYYYANRAIWYYDREKAGRGKVLDFVASDLLTDDVSGLLELADGRLALLTVTYGERGQEPSLMFATHIPPEEVKDKEEITVSYVYADSAVVRRAVAFNRESEDYRIRLADYSQYQSESDWTYPYTKLNTDIVSGYIPDILLIDEMMPLESYIGKGILSDLTPFIEQDAELSTVRFLDNIADAYRIDGKLYQLIPAFMVYTGVMKSDLLGERQSLTMRDLAEICGEHGIALKDSFGSMTRDELLNVLLYMQGAEYIDLETGKCAFDSPAFIELLTLVKQFPTKESDEDYASRQTAYREGRAALMLYGLGDFEDYTRLKYGNFGEEITMIGIPGGEGSGSVILPQMQLAVTTSSKHPEAAWAFVRSFLLEDYQDGLEWEFPVRLDSLEKMAEKAKERPYYIDETGEKIEYDDSWWIGGQEVTIPPLTDDEAAQMIDFLSGCDRRSYGNGTVSGIVTEEAAAFFEGQKSAEDVAKIIQSRAQIYVHENR